MTAFVLKVSLDIVFVGMQSYYGPATIFFFNFEIFQPLTCYPRPSTYYPRKHRTCTKINSLTNTASKQSLQTYKNLGNLSCIFRMKLNKNGQKKLTTYIKLMIIQVLKDDRGQCWRTKSNLKRSGVIKTFAVCWWVECDLKSGLCHSSG